MRKKTTLALILMMNLACAMAQKSGTTGPLSWNYNETSKELTITGNGAMPNYDFGAAPWQEYQEGIETVNVGSGVTSIGNNAFCNCIYMTTLSLPAGMETIGDNATTEGQQADKAERVYSRDGVQLRGTLSQQQKGVYIVGGKKVVKR